MADTAIISMRAYAQRRDSPKCHDSKRRGAIIVAHQKNVAAVRKLIRAAAECISPDARYGNVSSYLGRAKEIACLRCYSEPLWVEPPKETNGGSSR